MFETCVTQYRDNNKGFERVECGVTGLVGTLGLTIWSFHKVEPLAAMLLLPYLAWAVFAAFLTSTLINLNPQVCP